MDPEELRLVVAVPVLEEPVERLVCVFWSTVPAERVVVEPVLRLVVEVPVERLVVEVPVLRLVVEVEDPVERLVRVFWLTPPEDRDVWTAEERDGAAEEEALP